MRSPRRRLANLHDDRLLRHAGNARPGTARTRAAGRTAAADRACQGQCAGVRSDAGRRRRGRDHVARRAGAAAGDAQVRAARNAEGSASVRWLCRHRVGCAAPRVPESRSDLRTGGRAARSLAPGARAVRRGIPRGRSRAQLLFVSLHAGRIDARNGSARAGMHGRSRAAPARPNCRCRRSRTCGRRVTSARRRFSGSSSRRPTSKASRCRRSPRPLFPRKRFRRACATRSRDAASHGYQVYASADLGSIAYETSAREGLIVDEGVLVEIVRPGTGDPVAPGEVGEVVVTTLVNADYPLLRFGTGDLSALLPGVSPCGRTNMRIKGWMGRADQTTKVKGMFVHPSQVAAIVKRHPRNREGAPRRRQSGRQRPDDAACRGPRQRVGAGRGHRRVDSRHHQAARRSRPSARPASCPTTAR